MLCKYLWIALYCSQLVTALSGGWHLSAADDSSQQLVTALGSFMLRVLSSQRQLSTALCWMFLAAEKMFLIAGDSYQRPHFVSSMELKTVHINRWQLSAAGDSSKELVTSLSSWWQLSAADDSSQQLMTAFSGGWHLSAADDSSQQLMTALSSWWQLSAAGDSSQGWMASLSSWWQLSAAGDSSKQLVTALSSWWQLSTWIASQQLTTAMFCWYIYLQLLCIAFHSERQLSVAANSSAVQSPSMWTKSCLASCIFCN
jgi:hypothetical protein